MFGRHARSAGSGRRSRSAVLVATGAVALALASAAPAAAAPAAPAAAPTTAGYSGDAFGSAVFVGSVTRSGPSALVTLGCGTPAGFHAQNSAASLNLGATLSTGTVATTGDTGVSPDATRTSATTQNVSLLNGLITAAAVRSVSLVTHPAAGYQTSAAGTTLTTLKVAGVAVPVNAAPNTTIALPGIGVVVVNEQVASVTADSATLTVNGLHVVVRQANALGLGVGTNIIVSQARSTLAKPQTGFLSGVAYGTLAQVGAVLSSGPSFPQYMPCLGTNGAVQSNTGAGITVPGVLTSGTVTDTAQGIITTTGVSGRTASTVQSANLLAGLVTATGIKAVATIAKTNGVITGNDTGSGFASIALRGTPLNVNAAKNTRIVVPDVGVLYLRRNLTTANQIEVRMIELDVTATNIVGVPAGTVVLVGVARVAAF